MILAQEKRNALKRKLHTFSGEDLAGPVIAWYEDSDCAPDDPVRRLLEFAGRPWDVQEAIEFVEATETGLGLRFYRAVSLTPEGIKLSQQHESKLPITPRNSKFLLAWNNAVLLWSRGLLDRIRVCAKESCGTLFFARFSHSKYHLDQCRIDVEVANPEYKKQHSEYMRRQRKAKNRKKGK